MIFQEAFPKGFDRPPFISGTIMETLATQRKRCTPNRFTSLLDFWPAPDYYLRDRPNAQSLP
jgi:hypothetical protein